MSPNAAFSFKDLLAQVAWDRLGANTTGKEEGENPSHSLPASERSTGAGVFRCAKQVVTTAVSPALAGTNQGKNVRTCISPEKGFARYLLGTLHA